MNLGLLSMTIHRFGENVLFNWNHHQLEDTINMIRMKKVPKLASNPLLYIYTLKFSACSGFKALDDVMVYQYISWLVCVSLCNLKLEFNKRSINVVVICTCNKFMVTWIRCRCEVILQILVIKCQSSHDGSPFCMPGIFFSLLFHSVTE